MMARAIGRKLNEAWGQPVVIDNRPGGTGAVSSVLVAKSPPDGYTLLLVTSSTHAISPSVNSKLPYHPVKDFAPVSLVATGPQVLTVHPSVPVKTVKDLVALAKARPDSLNYASSGTGTVGHMLGEMFKTATGTKMVHVPYKSASLVITDLIGGHVQVVFTGPGAVIPHIKLRRLKALAVAYPRRTIGLEDVPTFAQAGYPAVDAPQWYGVLTTAGTPEPVVDKLSREIGRIVQLPEIKQQFFAAGYYGESNTPQEFDKFIRDELAKWQKVVKDSGMRVD